jgi:hypothetical protein
MFEQIATFERMLNERNVTFSESINLYLSIAEELERHSGHEFKGRAAFIRDQYSGFDAGRLFQKYRGAAKGGHLKPANSGQFDRRIHI